MRNLNNLKDLRNLIFQLSFECSELIDEYKNKLAFLLVVEEDLNNNKLSLSVKKYFQEHYHIDVEVKSLEKYKNTISNDIFILQNQILIAKKREFKLNKSHKLLKSYEIIDEDIIKFIKEELESLQYDNITIVTIIEKIKIHNTFEYQKNKDLKYSKDIHDFINMLNTGYEYIPIDFEIDSKERLNTEVNNIINILKENSFSIVTDNLVLENYYDYKELKYIYAKVLRYYQKAMMDTIHLIVEEKDFYFDNELLVSLKKEYYNNLHKYLFIRDLYDHLREENYEIDEEEYSFEETDINKLYYSTISHDPSKCYFVKDLMCIREEALDTVQMLLNDFKKGYINNAKKLTTGALELKYDQVRIILKRIKGNLYSVLGVFIKKSDNLHDTYTMITNRKDALIDDEYSKEVEDYYNSYIDENKRDGSR